MPAPSCSCRRRRGNGRRLGDCEQRLVEPRRLGSGHAVSGQPADSQQGTRRHRQHAVADRGADRRDGRTGLLVTGRSASPPAGQAPEGGILADSGTLRKPHRGLAPEAGGWPGRGASPRARTRTRGDPAAPGDAGGSRYRIRTVSVGAPSCCELTNGSPELYLRQHPGIPLAAASGTLRPVPLVARWGAPARRAALLAVTGIRGGAPAAAPAAGATAPGRGAPGARRVSGRFAPRRTGRIDPVRYPISPRWPPGPRGSAMPTPCTTPPQGRAPDPRRRRPVPGSGRPPLPSAFHLRRARPPRLPHGKQRGGHRPLPAEPLQGRPHPAAGDHPAAELGPGRALRPFRPEHPPGTPAHVLDEARPAAPRALHLPALGARTRTACATWCRA